MTGGQGIIIAKRSVALSKTYPVLGTVMALIGVFLSGSSGVIGSLATTGFTGVGSHFASALPLFSVALLVYAAILFAMPVLLLFVYDKNNGALEYFLSLGMNQGDIYRQYLKAALILASGLVCFEVVFSVALGLADGTGAPVLLEVSGLVAAMALPTVSLGTMIMMSFSSLQKQRVGSNQPLGMAIGVFMVLPAYIVPLIAPALALTVDLTLATVITALCLSMYISSSRLISREKLLP